MGECPDATTLKRLTDTTVPCKVKDALRSGAGRRVFTSRSILTDNSKPKSYHWEYISVQNAYKSPALASNGL